MANITKSERHNRMLDRVFDHYRKHQQSLPQEPLFTNFLQTAVEKLNISEQEARSKYGQYTVQEWETLLNLGWNSGNTNNAQKETEAAL
jgi:hypothetical protein